MPRIGKQKRCCFPSGECQTSHFLATWQKLSQLGWDALPHLPYSLDIALLDFCLLRSLQNNLNGENFNSLNGIKNALMSSLLRNQDGIFRLKENKRKVVQQNHPYLVE